MSSFRLLILGLGRVTLHRWNAPLLTKTQQWNRSRRECCGDPPQRRKEWDFMLKKTKQNTTPLWNNPSNTNGWNTAISWRTYLVIQFLQIRRDGLTRSTGRIWPTCLSLPMFDLKYSTPTVFTQSRATVHERRLLRDINAVTRAGVKGRRRLAAVTTSSGCGDHDVIAGRAEVWVSTKWANRGVRLKTHPSLLRTPSPQPRHPNGGSAAGTWWKVKVSRAAVLGANWSAANEAHSVSRRVLVIILWPRLDDGIDLTPRPKPWPRTVKGSRRVSFFFFFSCWLLHGYNAVRLSPF